MEVKRLQDIEEENGKTRRENNLECAHNIPINELVEVSQPDGDCDKIRLYVTEHIRDCDGTPLYNLGIDGISLLHNFDEKSLSLIAD